MLGLQLSRGRRARSWSLRGAPNLVCTTFVGNALLDAFESLGDSQYLDMAASAAKYIHDELLWTGPEVSASLSYPVASSRVPVHNANFLGAAFLCRVFRHSGETGLLDDALKVARYSASRQHDDGSWDYGESPNQALGGQLSHRIQPVRASVHIALRRYAGIRLRHPPRVRVLSSAFLQGRRSARGISAIVPIPSTFTVSLRASSRCSLSGTSMRPASHLPAPSLNGR